LVCRVQPRYMVVVSILVLKNVVPIMCYMWQDQVYIHTYIHICIYIPALYTIINVRYTLNTSIRLVWKFFCTCPILVTAQVWKKRANTETSLLCSKVDTSPTWVR
jgi:hypothetical protein